MLLRKKDLIANPSLSTSPLDVLIQNQTLKQLRAKFTKRQDLRRKQAEVIDKRAKDLLAVKKERNTLVRKEGEVWKSGDAYKMEWTFSPL